MVLMWCLSPAPSERSALFFQSLREEELLSEKTMAEVAPAPAPAPAKAAKKKAAPRPKKTGPSVAELVVKAVSASKERSGVSLAASDGPNRSFQ